MEKTRNRNEYLKKFGNIKLDSPDLIPDRIYDELRNDEFFKEFFDKEVN